MSIISTSFERRFEPYHDQLLGYAVALARDRESARELLHDCVARAASAREMPESEPAFRSWLFTIMRNLWIDHLRASRRKALFEDQLSGDVANAPVSLENVVVNAFAVRQAFETLALEHREVLALVDISGFSYQETASILSIPRGTVMSRVSRARQNLARLLAEDRIAGLPRSKLTPGHE